MLHRTHNIITWDTNLTFSLYLYFRPRILQHFESYMNFYHSPLAQSIIRSSTAHTYDSIIYDRDII
jgi:hypothetical protein